MPLKSWSEMMKDAESNATGFQPLEEGSYDFVIEKPAEVGETGKGYPKFILRATVENGPRANAVQIHRLNASESAYAMKNFFFKPLYAMGITPEFLSSDPTNEQIANALQGKRFSARVQKQKDNPEYTELVDFAPASGAAPARPAAGVPTPQGLPQGQPQAAPAAPAAPAQQAPAPQAPAQTPAPAQVPDASPAVAPPAAPASDGNPWATSPPPAPVF